MLPGKSVASSRKGSYRWTLYQWQGTLPPSLLDSPL